MDGIIHFKLIMVPVETFNGWCEDLSSENPDLKFVMNIKPREPRIKMSYDSVARTLLGIEK